MVVRPPCEVRHALEVVFGGGNEPPVCAQSPYEHCGSQRAGLKHNLNVNGWNSQVHRGFPGKFESSNVSRDNVSREIGRTPDSDHNQLLHDVLSKDWHVCHWLNVVFGGGGI